MALNFPSSPTTGDKFPAAPIAGIPTYTWDGEKWTTSGPSLGQYVAKAGDAMSGHLSLPTGPAAANAVRKDYVDAAAAAATAAEYIANSAPTKLLTPGAVWTAAAIFTLTDGTTVTPNFSNGIDFVWTIGAAGRTLANPTSPKPGQKGMIYLVKGTAAATITTWGSQYKFPGGIKPALSAAAGAVDVISYACKSVTEIECFFTAGMA